jgi:hypothetical protein
MSVGSSSTYGGVTSESCMLAMRTKRGVGLRLPEKGTGIYCCINSSQVLVAAGRSAGPGSPSEPNIIVVY